MLLGVFISYIIYGSVSWLEHGGRRENKLSGSVYRKMKLNSFHTCMCFAQNSVMQHEKLWLGCLWRCTNIHQKNKVTLTWTTTFLQEHIFFWPYAHRDALGSQHNLAPAPSMFCTCLAFLCNIWLKFTFSINFDEVWQLTYKNHSSVP